MRLRVATGEGGGPAVTLAGLQQLPSGFGAMSLGDRPRPRLSRFGAEHRPNLYQRACFGNRVKWALKEAGYPAPFVEVATHEFIPQMTLPSAPPRSRNSRPMK